MLFLSKSDIVNNAKLFCRIKSHIGQQPVGPEKSIMKMEGVFYFDQIYYGAIYIYIYIPVL